MAKQPRTPSNAFDYVPEVVEDTGSFRPGDFEAMYVKLFAESLQAGPITAEDRARLDIAAKALGLEPERMARLEDALLRQWEATEDSTLVDPEDPSTLADRGPPSTLASAMDSLPRDPAVSTAPEEELPTVRKRQQRSVPETDSTDPPTRPRKKGVPVPRDPNEQGLSSTNPNITLRSHEEAPPPPVVIVRDPLPVPPRPPPVVIAEAAGMDAETIAIRERYLAMGRTGRLDEQWCAAAVLVNRGVASDDELALFDRYRMEAPPRPQRALTAETWHEYLLHPDQDRLAGEIFAVVASAALLGRAAAMKRDGTLPHIDMSSLQDPASSTVSAVRAMAWSAATLGMHVPPLTIAPELDTSLDMLTAVPPVTRIGAQLLTGRSSLELAFACGRHLAWYREDIFVCTLVPSLSYLEDIFYAAISLGEPSFSLPPDLRARTNVIAAAMHPCLEPAQLDRLRRAVHRFLTEGGSRNLKRWTRAAEYTSCRTGMLLCGDLAVATSIVSREQKGAQRVRQIELFWVSDEAAALRRHLGVGL